MVTTKTMDQNISKTFCLVLLAVFLVSISDVDCQSTPTGKFACHLMDLSNHSSY